MSGKSEEVPMCQDHPTETTVTEGDTDTRAMSTATGDTDKQIEVLFSSCYIILQFYHRVEFHVKS